VTVLDTSGVVDFVLGIGAAAHVGELMAAEGELAAPDLMIFEALAVFRRHTLAGDLPEGRAAGAVADLGALSVELFPSLPLRERAWDLRRNLTAGDALFVALAERLDEPLATKDGALAAAVLRHTSVEVVALSSS
jgi:predicted nucleic acid-binding protein